MSRFGGMPCMLSHNSAGIQNYSRLYYLCGRRH
nr:MAG TPA: hypothetical protein [Caudoviricetes sp.]